MVYSLVMAAQITEISSLTNPRVKALRALERKKTRDETGLFLAEGPRLVQQGLAAGWSLDTLVVATRALERDYVSELVAAAGETGADVLAVPDRVIAKIARKDNPNAVLGAFEQKTTSLDALDANGKDLWIALYEVRDPGNLGTILRTADCAGVGGVILLETCCDPFSIEAVRASMGSVFDVAMSQSSFADFDIWRRSGELSLMAASMRGDKRHDLADLSGPTAIIMGNEQSGLPEPVEAACDQLLRIPMRGGADSLNLAQATAILTYEAWRQQGFQ